MIETDDEFQRHVRHIKWILAGVLGCMVLIVLALLPVLVPMLLVVVVALILGGLLYVSWSSFRQFVDGVKTRAMSLWHRGSGI